MSELQFQNDEQPLSTDETALRRPSFMFAKRHGLLVTGEQDGKVLVMHTGQVEPSALVELRRFVGKPLSLQAMEPDQFEALLASSYEQGSSEAMQMMGDLGDGMDLMHAAEALPGLGPVNDPERGQAENHDRVDLDQPKEGAHGDRATRRSITVDRAHGQTEEGFAGCGGEERFGDEVVGEESGGSRDSSPQAIGEWEEGAGEQAAGHRRQPVQQGGVDAVLGEDAEPGAVMDPPEACEQP